ncbi:transcriptional regulator [Pseudorhizobium flavum]|uniref:HVO_A0114 family putative DNA-binding protein n=1 Tax=Pseudorhizobium flavum TaxID=1335061 RepID=UPI0024913891|nr:transcriptional regulator [Pseudorhizobium flavum]
MTTLTVKIESLEDTMARAVSVVSQSDSAVMEDPAVTLSFPSWEVMHRVLAPKRLDILKVLVGQGPLSIREVARRLGRDFEGVHTDVDTLVQNGVVDKTKGGIVFPYERVHFDFDIRAAA